VDDALNGPPARISVRGLVVRRGIRVTADIPSFDLLNGEVLALIGPNGAGKSTLIAHMALLERAREGTVLFDGAPVRGRELALRRRIATVFQEPLLLDRTAAANVEVGLRLRGVARAQRSERVGRWLARFGVAHLAERSARTLSGGEAQRVSLARAFALEPEVLLLDEPFAALDQPTREALIEELAAALDQTRVPAIVVTHHRDEAARLGDRVAVMIGGRIRQTGTPQEVFGAPADEGVAAFVGVETIFPARVVARDNGLVRLAANGIEVEAVGEGEYADALVCIRPEDVSITPPGEHIAGSARNRLAGRVRSIRATGVDARVDIDCGVAIVARVTQRSLEDLSVGVGSPVVASFKATAVHLIPKR
jgi:tungstate transport system ATP-binding protein